MRAQEFVKDYQGIDIAFEQDADEITVRALAGGREMGHAVFVVDGATLLPQDLEVDERFRGQGIAAVLYDYLKARGYRIRRSGQQTDAGSAFWQKHRPGKNIWESVDVNQALLATARKRGGNIDDYFVRVTDQDKVGFSARQHIGRTPDVGDPDWHIDYIGRGRGRPAVWFYPLRYYLQHSKDLYAADRPYVWLARLKPNAWLQTVDAKTKEKQPAPQGQQRVGIFRKSMVPAVIFFTPGYDIVDRWYDYGQMHKRRKQ